MFCGFWERACIGEQRPAAGASHHVSCSRDFVREGCRAFFRIPANDSGGVGPPHANVKLEYVQPLTLAQVTTSAVDLWALGCIMYSIRHGSNLFCDGNRFSAAFTPSPLVEHLLNVVSALGAPSGPDVLRFEWDIVQQILDDSANGKRNLAYWNADGADRVTAQCLRYDRIKRMSAAALWTVCSTRLVAAQTPGGEAEARAFDAGHHSTTLLC